MSSIDMAQAGPIGSPVTHMAMNQGYARVQIHQLSPAQRMPNLQSEKVLYGARMTGAGKTLDIDV